MNHKVENNNVFHSSYWQLWRHWIMQRPIKCTRRYIAVTRQK